jgi:hypothetical protein
VLQRVLVVDAREATLADEATDDELRTMIVAWSASPSTA